jgi:TfoX/Sxy family transcriptional regulator of competence genes
MAMPKLEKSPPELVKRFDDVVARLETEDAAAAGVRFERRKMFGYPSLFVDGNLATGLHGPGWMVRLAPDDVAALLATPSARPFEPMPGRPMKGYALLPPDVVEDDALLEQWVRRALGHAATLPPK